MSSSVEIKNKRIAPTSLPTSADLHQTSTTYERLKCEWEKERPDLKKCGDLLAELKVRLVTIRFLPAKKTKASKQELLFARNVLEIGVLWSVAVRDLIFFERYMALLKCYYFDYKDLIIESKLKYEILGLNLLFLLSQNRIADFHTELELLTYEEILRNEFIQYPVAVDQYLMEGSYNKIYRSKLKIPSKYYNFFVDILMDTVRGEIAECIEKAYPKILIKEAMKKLFLNDEESTKMFGVNNRKWKLQNGYFYFIKDVKIGSDVVEPIKLAEGVLGYAKELEMIV